MPAYYCPECDDAYPKHSMFNDCPLCGTSTKVKNFAPDVDMDEGERRVRYVKGHEKFNAWLKENGREDPAPIKVRVMYEGATIKDVEYALDLANALEWNDPLVTIGTLYVFAPGA